MHHLLEIEIGKYLHDHHFEGRCVFPAVEALKVLAQIVQNHFPKGDLRCLNKARFPRFLTIPPEMQKLPVIVEIDNTLDRGISAWLMTSIRSKTGGIGRNLEHARVEFPRADSTHDTIPPPTDLENPEEPVVVVPDGSIYPGLIPFGKAFQNIVGSVSLWPEGASASLSGGDQGKEDDRLGSPFPFDAAIQVACVWGQRFTEYVLFPVGFEKRIIYQKTKIGRVYHCRIFPAGSHQNVHLFDVLIVDSQGTLHEEIRGIQMQDVSQGRLHPPSWIKAL